MSEAQENTNRDTIDLDTFFSANLDLLCIADTSGHFIRVNKSWADTLGYTIEDLEGKTFLDLVHPDDRQATLAAMADLENQEDVLNFVNRYRCADATYRHIEWRSRPRGSLIYAAARDVTDRVLAQEEITRLNKALEHNPASVVIADLDGTITYVNEKFTEITGYTREEALGKNPNILNSGEQTKDFYRELWETIKGGDTWKGEFHNKKKNGELYWERARISPLFSETGKVVQFVAIKEDITAQKEAEEALEESRIQLDLFFKQSLDGVFFMMLDEPVEWNEDIDKDAALDYIFSHQRITRINRAMLDQYKASAGDFLGKTPEDFFEHDPEQGREIWRKFFDDGKLHIDTREQRFDGTSMIIEGDYICLYDARGRITGHFGVQRDVTFAREAGERLVESEEKFRQLAENIDEVFFLWVDDRFIYVSPTYERIWQQPCDRLLQDSEAIYEPIHPDDIEKVRQAYADIRESVDIEYRLLLPNDEVRWIWNRSFPVEKAEGKEQRVVSIAHDITDRKRLEEQLREASIRDALTGLYNRRYLHNRLQPLFEKARRGESHLSLAMLDIDRFKAINDTHGHSAGDVILKRFAEILRGHVRPYDLVGRYGGEEFVIVFSDIRRNTAAELVERILQLVREETIDFEGVTLSFTFSGGVSDTTECSLETCTYETLVDKADAKLYKAKEGGRNRVVV